MNTLVTSLSLILIGLAMSYPIFFPIIDRNVRDGNSSRSFLQVNYILHIIAGSVAVLLLWIYRINYPLQISGIIYLMAIIVVVLYYWKSPIPKWNLFGASFLFGFIVFYRSFNEIVEIMPLWPGIFTGLISAGVVNIVILLMVSSLKPYQEDGLRTFTNSLLNYFVLLIGIRIAWDIVILFNLSVETQYGDVINALKFFWQADSIKLSILIISGMMVPSLYFIILRKKLTGVNSKNRTLLLMILFLSIITAEFLCKYFLLQYGIVL